MSDEGDYWREVRPAMIEASKLKRAANRDSGAQLLLQAGVEFESKNGGAHLIVRAHGHTFDFWPGTGLWVMRGTTKRHRGVQSLLKVVKPFRPF